MKKFKALVLLLFILSGNMHAQIFSMGANFNLDQYNKAPLADLSAMGFGELPSSYSLKMYAPLVADQGFYGTCVGWSTSYAAMTIAWAKYLGETNTDKITASAFDPYFTYSKIKSPEDESCQMGSNIYDALTVFRNQGCKKLFLGSSDCGYNADEMAVSMAKMYRIKSFNRLFDYPSSFVWDDFFSTYIDKASPMKEALAAGQPVIIGTYLPNSIFQLTGSGIWEVTETEKLDLESACKNADGNFNGHAMCVVAYDDNVNGGSFEVMNSWSTEFGDNGFFWIKYEDMNRICTDAWTFELFHDELPQTGCLTGNCDNGWGIYKFDNGDTYEGHWENMAFDGYGIYKWSDGYSYSGQWKNDLRHGYAMTIYNKTQSFGYWDNDNSVSYSVSNDKGNSGCISGDCENGYGTYVYGNGSYTGTFKNGYRDGFGTYLFDGGSSVASIWSNGTKVGFGKITFTGGQSLIVEFNNDYANGYGLVYQIGGYYTGMWIDGEYVEEDALGFGGKTMTEDPSKLIKKQNNNRPAMAAASSGCISGDCENGYGTVQYDNGAYTGYFKDGYRNGYGVYAWSDGIKYEGNWDRGLQDGMGKMLWPTGEYFFGEYRRGSRDGYGLEIHPDFMVAGIWEMDNYQPGKAVLGFGEEEIATLNLNDIPVGGSNPASDQARASIAAKSVQSRK